jgi:hypothetical protein
VLRAVVLARDGAKDVLADQARLVDEAAQLLWNLEVDHFLFILFYAAPAAQRARGRAQR